MDWTLAAGFENLIILNDISESGFTGIGNELDNQLIASWAGSRLEGRDGDDTLIGADGQGAANELLGGAGNDSLFSGGLGDRLDGGIGADTLTGADTEMGEYFVFSAAPGAANADVIFNFEFFSRIVLDAAAMPALGASGTFDAADARFAANSSGSAQDTSDRVVYNTSNGQLWYDADGNGTGAAQLIATLQGAPGLTATDIVVENGTDPGPGGRVINGTSGNDSLAGTDRDDTINGFAGDDTLEGAGGDDTLTGGLDNDWLTGGAGADIFAMDVPPNPAGYDRISDFTTGVDRIQLDGNVFAAVGISGDFSAGDDRFKVGWDLDSTDRVIYDPSSGHLFYDFDGSGGGAGRIFATFWPNTPSISAADFTVVNGQSGAPQTINGTGGDDSLIGAHGNDTIDGLGGDDTLWGVGGDDSLSGGDGRDVLEGGDGDDTLLGGEGEGFYHGGAGDDSLVGGAGNEEFYPGEGSDRVEAGAGEDFVSFAGISIGGADVLNGGAGSDLLRLTLESAAVIDVAAGTVSGGGPSGSGSITFSSFEIFSLSTDFSVDFTAANESVEVSTSGNATLRGGSGDDVLFSGGGVFSGGEGADTMSSGEAGVSTFIFNTAPSAGNADTIFQFVTGVYSLQFDASVFTAIGAAGKFSAGDDRFHSANGATQGHDATDRLIYNSGNGDLWYDADGNGSGTSVLVATLPRDTGGAEVYSVAATDIWVFGSPPSGTIINGTSGADTLADTSGNDTINGLAGNDTINAGNGGTDVVNGGDGRDTLAFMTAASAVVVDFVAGTAGNTSFTEIEKAVTGDFNDTLTGNGAAQNLTARAGSDTLAGAGGVDTLWGGAGNDTFIFRETGTANADTIGDWTSGSDEFALDNAAMEALGADGAFVAGDARFWASSTGAAHDANDRVLFNSSTGSLYYDPDGNGSGAAQLIATFTGSPTVVATDISVI
jgi:Ca2+-binding RTX toxin-like protein